MLKRLTVREWFVVNSKQIGVLVLSVITAVAIHRWPDWRDTILIMGASLGGIGIHLPAIQYRKSNE